MAAKRTGRRRQPPAQEDAPGGRRLSQKQETARQGNAKRRRRRRHGNYILYYILLVLLLVATGVVLSLTVFFKIETVTVVGTDKYPNNEMVQRTGVVIGENLFRIDTRTIEKNMREYPYVEGVEIRRNYPPEVVVTVTEATPMAVVEMNEGYTVISTSGRILETGLGEPPASLPLVTGLRMPGRPGEMVGEDAQEGLNTLRYITQALASVGFDSVQAIDLSDRLNIVLVYSDDITIELGVENDLDRKLKLVAEVLENQLEHSFKGTLYADTVGKVWADPEDQAQILPVDLDEYVFDEESQTFIKRPQESSGEDKGSSEGGGQTGEEGGEEPSKDQDIVD